MPEHDQEGKTDERLKRRHKHAPGANEFDIACDVLAIGLVETTNLGFLLRVGADHADAGEILLHFSGKRGERGLNRFVEIVDNSEALVDVAIDGSDAGLLRSGEKASLKFESFPERTFRGQVVVVSPQGLLKDNDVVFFARVGVTNADAALRTGMQGRGKIVTGWRPAGLVMLRRPAMWIWSKLWSWFGW